jgi:hypothetical protein
MPHFSDEPDASPLQLAGDAALRAIQMVLTEHDIDIEDYSVVLCLEHGADLATVLHIPGDFNDAEQAVRAFETQLMHLQLSSHQLGVTISVVPVGRG